MRALGIHKDQIYHIYNREVNRQNIFSENSNWLFFLKLMRNYFQPDEVDLLAYCLMPNHFHFLIYIKCDDFGSRIMMPFMVSFTRSINHQEKRVGSLFQGTYKAKLIDNDESLIHVSRYIHLNPFRAGLVKNLENWKYSSYPDYLGLRKGKLPNKNLILSFFPSSDAYKLFVEEEQSIEINKYIFNE